MSVPLDNLYHWVESLVPGPVFLYVFHPHGSKKISDCDWFRNYEHHTNWRSPSGIVHDQEPLDWDSYNNPDHYIQAWKTRGIITDLFFTDYNLKFYSKFNLKSLAFIRGMIYDQVILIHSEKNSLDLIKYQNNGFVCVHYWAHAIIAKDWYRFAEYDKRLQTTTSKKNKFLIYCRDWSHSREYRLKFLEMLVTHNLAQVSQTTVMHINSEGKHFSEHKFKNVDFELINPESIDQISSNLFCSTASANYEPNDFANSEISVVLETVFDDSRIHLTEKTLRPIACEHPFILAAGPGSLEYIRSYGFQTFAPWIDESYDQEKNSFKRLEKIIKSMKQIQNLQGQELENFSKEIKKIAMFNKNHFFSAAFFDKVQDELKNNLDLAYNQVKKTKGKHYLEFLKLLKSNKTIHTLQNRSIKTKLLKQLRQSCRDNRSNPAADLSV